MFFVNGAPLTPHKLFEIFNPKRNWKYLFNPPSMHYNVLDFFRAVAMLWIVCKHSAQVYFDYIHPEQIQGELLSNPFFKPLFAAEFAVDIFFVLSGFLISSILFKDSLLNNGIKVGNFYIRRALRMLPIYYFVILIVVLANHFHIFPYIFKGPASGSPIANIFYYNNFTPRNERFMNWTWSLAIEEQFYFTFPLFLLVCEKFKLSVLRTLLISVLLIISIHYFILISYNWETFWIPFPKANQIASDRYFTEIYSKPYVRFSSLLIGAIGGYLKFRNIDKLFFANDWRKIVTLISSTLFIIFAYLGQSYDHKTSVIFQAFYREFFSIGFTGIILWLTRFRISFGPLVNNLSYPIFQLTYGIYLIHVFVVIFLYRFIRIGDFVNLSDTTLVFLFSIAVGIISFVVSGLITIPIYIFLERPMMNFRETYFPPKIRSHKV